MTHNFIRRFQQQKSDLPSSRQFPLRLVLIVPFVLQISVAVGLVGYLSFRNGQQAVNDLAYQLMNEVNTRVDKHLDNYLEQARNSAKLNADSISTGLVSTENLAQFQRYLWKQTEVSRSGFILYGNTQGEFVATGYIFEDDLIEISEILPKFYGNNNVYSYATDSQGKKSGYTQAPIPYDFQKEGWYAETLQAKKPLWTSIYAWEFPPYPLAIAYGYPIYDKNQQIVGSIGVEKRLSEISDFLKTIQGSPSMKVFILERNGLLVADSSNENPFTIVEEKAIRLPGTASKEPLIQATAKYLEQKFGQFQNIQGSQQLFFWRDGQKQFIQLNSWRDADGLDWLVVVVVPESDFMAQINANNNSTLFLCLLSLIVTTGLGILTAQWVTSPVQQINEASGAIAQGELQPVVATGGIRELTALAKSFNIMVSRLQISFDTLEQRVAERTAELAIAKEKAEIANHAKSTFIANMSHELRSPLNAIMGFSQLMQHTPNLPEEQYENAEIIYRSGDYLLTLINNILDLSKIEANKTVLNIQEFNLHNLLDDLEAMLQMRASSANLSLIFERSPEVPMYIYGDDIKLRQVLINLLTNAVKFTQRGAIVLSVDCEFPSEFPADVLPRPDLSQLDLSQLDLSQLDLSKPDLSKPDLSKPVILYFSVRDTGVGIAPEELAQIFEAFTQAEAGRARQEGTGLGLTISRKFVQLMGGDITLESTLGKGTTFQFQIQATLGTGENHTSFINSLRPHRNCSILGLAPGQPIYRILIVDDKPINRQLLIKMLNPLGFQLREASNGQEAINLWSSWSPHLIWMDIRMPVMDGYEATKYIRAKPQGTDTVIIALTASVLEEERAVTLASGCNDFLSKPFREQDIFDTLTNYLGVQYIYAEEETLKLTSELTLNPEQLTSMPSVWIKQLYKAAIEGDMDLISSLITEIPPRESELAKNLKELVQQFQFEVIINLLEPMMETA